MLQFFTKHPAAAGETYLEHLVFAGTFGSRMLAGGLACCVHGVLPWLFTTTGSRTVTRLHEQLVENRRRAAL